MSGQEARSGEAATGNTKSDQAPPHEGGSYVVGKDGKPVRTEFTIQPGEPGHGVQAAPPPVPAADAKKRGK